MADEFDIEAMLEETYRRQVCMWYYKDCYLFILVIQQNLRSVLSMACC